MEEYVAKINENFKTIRAVYIDKHQFFVFTLGVNEMELQKFVEFVGKTFYTEITSEHTDRLKKGLSITFIKHKDIFEITFTKI